ncbi:hypothetical protein SAMN05660297_00482 [Natronincola peptidivorans]|uniref:Ribosomal processing cysteine protease Prp n=1 Tax=Natronincola peptidivorans TaxID=426128 RepID=A0A1H9YZ69_9FIRM|nr:ribosomal-processing cysteine protease Prp [Natronincola peptidivorans]SES74565.1 hypothetical protein SAMN05660297_00482 [Natronincola peptidivorans]
MIIVNIKRDKNKNIREFIISGHAYADVPGKDIVCAAVSVLGQSVIIGLYEVIKISAPYEIKEGYLACTIPEAISQNEREQTNVLLETMVKGLNSIKNNYNKYIDIHDKEV